MPIFEVATHWVDLGLSALIRAPPEPEESGIPVQPGVPSPISRVLRLIGATLDPLPDGRQPFDEFEAIGLARHRDTADWPGAVHTMPTR